MVYNSGTVYLVDGKVIALRFVESMKFPDGGDKIIDKLKGDRCLEVTMTSGIDYIVSMRAIQKYDDRWKDADIDALREAICDRWIFLLGDLK